MTEKTWPDYVNLHSNLEGARSAFENDCEALFRELYPVVNVQKVRANPGDEGIDVYAGDLGISPIDVYQCKFFLDSLGKSQKEQIRTSFKRAIYSTHFKVKSWTLCIPLEDLDLQENKWWVGWKVRQEKAHGIPIRLIKGRELIDMFKAAGLYQRIFRLEDSLKIAAIHDAILGTGALLEASQRTEQVLVQVQTELVALSAPPSIQKDVEQLQVSTTDTLRRLGRFTMIDTATGPIHLERSFATALVRVAPHGSVALTGEPGAGKSAVLWTVAHELAREYPVVCLTVSGGVTSLEALRLELRLNHQLLDVLRAIASTEPAFLLLDALDAAREESAERSYQHLLEAMVLLPNWRVVASVRTFDLRRSATWQALFPGAPPEVAYANPDFGRVRHLHLGLLTEAERASLEHLAPALHEALVASGPKVEKLALNPFNLALLADLLRWGTRPADLARVATRGQLLRRYWDIRIDSLGTASFLGLASLVNQMLKARMLAVPRILLKRSTGDAIDRLLGAGVLQLEYPDRLAFRHHVLFDYAVARVALLDNPAKASKYLHKSHTAGLLLAPSLGYWLEELRNDPRDPTRRAYWTVVMKLAGSADVDPIVRVEVTRLVIEALNTANQLTELAHDFAQPTPAALLGFRLFVSALTARVEAEEEFAVEPWAHLLDQLGTPPDTHLGPMQGLLRTLLDVCHDPAATAALGRAARALYARISQHDGLSTLLGESAVGSVAWTYATDPAASYRALAGVFTPARLALVGFLEVPALAKHLLDFAESGPTLVVQLYHCAFQHQEFTLEGSAPLLRSYILSMSISPQDAFRMAEYELAEKYPTLLARFPVTGIRALAAALEGARLRHQPTARVARPPIVGVAGKMYALEEDGSVWWAEDLDATPGTNYAALYQAYQLQLPTLPSELLTATFPALLLGESRAALVWRVLFETGAAHPAALGHVLWAAAASKSALVLADTHRSAVAFLAAAYRWVPAARRLAAEQTWLAFSFDSYPQGEEVRLLTLGTLFTAIGEANLVTEEARAFLRTAAATDHSLTNEPLVSMGTYHPSEQPWSRQPEPPASAVPTELVLRVRAIAAARQTAERDPSAEHIVHLQQVLTALDAATHPADLDGEVLVLLAPSLVLTLVWLPGDHPWRTRAVVWLMALARVAIPTNGAAPVEATSRSLVLDVPSVPVAMAKAVATVAVIARDEPEVGECFEELLLHAEHPAVRGELAEALLALPMNHEEAAWRLTAQLVAREAHPAVLRQAFRSVDYLAHLDTNRAENLLLQLSAKTATPRPPEDVVTGRVVQLGLRDGREGSLALLHGWISRFAAEKDHLNAVLYQLRLLFPDGYDLAPHQASPAAVRARAFVLALISELEPVLQPLATLQRQATPEEVAANELFTGIAGQLYFGLGRSKLTAALVTPDARRHFLRDYAPVISRLARLGDPTAVDYLAKTIGHFIDAAPQLSFDLFSEAMLRNAGVADYENDPHGARHFVELVTRFLFDHRHLFAEESRRNSLIACLDLFLNVGWPEALPLFILLRDMQQ